MEIVALFTDFNAVFRADTRMSLHLTGILNTLSRHHHVTKLNLKKAFHNSTLYHKNLKINCPLYIKLYYPPSSVASNSLSIMATALFHRIPHIPRNLLHRRTKKKLQNLPIEIILCILDHLNPAERTLFSRTCKRYHKSPHLKHLCGPHHFHLRTRILQYICLFDLEYHSSNLWMDKLSTGAVMMISEQMMDDVIGSLGDEVIQPEWLAKGHLFNKSFEEWHKFEFINLTPAIICWVLWWVWQ